MAGGGILLVQESATSLLEQHRPPKTRQGMRFCCPSPRLPSVFAENGKVRTATAEVRLRFRLSARVSTTKTVVNVAFECLCIYGAGHSRQAEDAASSKPVYAIAVLEPYLTAAGCAG